MSGLAFTIPGDPRGKGRPRATTIGGHARMFTDSKTASYENLVKLAASRALGGRAPLDCPLTVVVTVRMTPAASSSRKKRASMLAGEMAPTKLPDLDNVVKAVLDGCNKVAFRDDALVVSLIARKRYAEVPGVDVEISPTILRKAAA
ncbi:RusA family crossover junction endodeoxyribonuclease [Brevundimonas diminuta]|uniref:RusA family crossover junction endodeoxyribonuclease n=1 Tax=Brevundimonas diminuta TaxID=293 RepID=UPI00058D174C|nr:RusA family crossover junction endodeoxyribonuclease [Brevundimonas diminuta]OWR16593.1 RusA family crossover junction endodeoxyribonuclease [Brevundimonas diminuta]WQE44795.1 RusA family crossover junction endodeoxyribonuclease [Brevundimonas diminuta]SUW17308.1 Holliday junction resolvase [Brevundimonas diminuta]